MVCVLFSRPAHDGTVSYLHYYTKELVKTSTELGYKTIDKEQQDANKKTLIKIISTIKPNLIFFNGHGSEDSIMGHKNEIIVSASENPELLKDAITYSLSCASAAILGQKAAQKGAVAFIGYAYDFALGKDPESEAVPARDKIAKLFLQPSNLLSDALLRGNSAGFAVEKAKKKMKDNIDYLNTTDDFPEAQHYAPFLFGNYLGLTVHGDPEAKIPQHL